MGCRRKAPKSELVRIVCGKQGRAVLDPDGTAAGRGAYVCSNVGCLQEAVRKKRIGSALRMTIDPKELPGSLERSLERLTKEFDAWQR